MQAIPLHLSDGADEILNELDIKLSFKPFISYLQKRIDSENTIKKDIFRYVLGKFNANEALTENLTLDSLGTFEDELSLAYSMLVPAIADEKEYLWALSIPVKPTIFYGTDGIYHLLTTTVKKKDNHAVFQENHEEHRNKKIQMIYSLILERLYGFTSSEKNEMIHSLDDEVTGLPRHYRISIDSRFVEIYPKATLPELNIKNLEHQLADGFDWHKLLTLYPLSNFRIEGFSVITITDITAIHAVENLKEVILNHSNHNDQDYYRNIGRSLKAMVQNPKIEFGLLPMLRVNNKPVFDDDSCSHSFTLKSIMKQGLPKKEFMEWAQDYTQHPRPLIFKNLNQDTLQEYAFLENLYQNGIRSYALLPIFFNNKTVGLLEVYSYEPDVLTESILAKLEEANALISQLLQSNIEEFDSKIDAIIKEKFTPLQPAVQWKFNEAALHFLRESAQGAHKPVIQKVSFKNVYPLYGAIDIRNSTLERNHALAADLSVQFDLLLRTLSALNSRVNIPIIDELIFKCKKWAQSIADAPANIDQNGIKNFLQHDVDSVLQHFRENAPDQTQLLSAYFDAIDETHGQAFANRRSLESAMQTINSAISQYLEIMRDEAQQTYPCYFEKFRTDGVEYDIYIGQSIFPEKKFIPLYLKNIRLQQLASMAAIAKITHALLPQLEKKLLTTQLIFIHSSEIDISFRNDERRFDVEGSYNIRYHVVKKRIDKVHIKGTNERLTQPGKIALVYMSEEEAKEYIEYIHFLHEQNILSNNPEFLELEDLQGVTGLKAIRIDVLL